MASKFGSTIPLSPELEAKWDDIIETAALVLVDQIRKGKKLSLARIEKVMDIAAHSPKVAEALKAALAATKTKPKRSARRKVKR
jgi:hypothetical protein